MSDNIEHRFVAELAGELTAKRPTGAAVEIRIDVLGVRARIERNEGGRKVRAERYLTQVEAANFPEGDACAIVTAMLREVSHEQAGEDDSKGAPWES